MNIKILGPGCLNCKKLYQVVIDAVKEMNLDANIEKVEDIKRIMGYGVMRTPALVINEKVKVFGRVSSKDEVKKYIEEEM